MVAVTATLSVLNTAGVVSSPDFPSGKSGLNKARSSDSGALAPFESDKEGETSAIQYPRRNGSRVVYGGG
jgi:hypothetical protein